jgi:hypothetical protein
MQMRFGNALIGLISLDRSEVRDWMMSVGEILSQGGAETVTKRVEILEKVATIQQIGIQYLGLLEWKYTSLEKLSRDVEETLEIAMEAEFEVGTIQRETIEQIGGLWAPAQILATLKKEESNYPNDIRNFKRVLSAILIGNYESYRNQNQARQVAYKENDETFWDIFNGELEKELPEVLLGTKKVESRFRLHIEELQEVLRGERREDQVEGVDSGVPVDSEILAIRELMRLEPSQLEQKKSGLHQQIQIISQRLSQVTDQGIREELIAERERMKALLGWMEVIEVLEEIRAMKPFEVAISEVKQWKRLFDSQGRRLVEAGVNEKVDRVIIGEMLLGIAQQLELIGSERVYKKVTIRYTSDPGLIMRRGMLRPDMVNCFHLQGDPRQVHTLVNDLSSRNIMMLMVETEGEPASYAMVKVRQDSEESPVIFIERPLYRWGYDFEEEMVEFLKPLADKLGAAIAVMVRKKGEGEIERVGTTGGIGDEYAEALFGVRPQKGLYHSAKMVYRSHGYLEQEEEQEKREELVEEFAVEMNL